MNGCREKKDNTTTVERELDSVRGGGKVRIMQSSPRGLRVEIGILL
jgi:hypothetical protein